MTSSLTDRLRAELLASRRARRTDDVATLRTALAALANAEAVPAPDPAAGLGDGRFAGTVAGVGAADVARREVDDAEQRAVLRDEIAELESAAAAYDASAPDRAARARGGAALLRRVLAETA